MKKLFMAGLALSGLMSVTLAQKEPGKKKADTTVTKTTGKYTDNVDDRMKGPGGEKVYIGPNGGRYYLKDGKKVYVEYKGKKKKGA